MMLAASDEALASGDRAAADEYGWAAEALLDRIRARSRRWPSRPAVQRAADHGTPRAPVPHGDGLHDAGVIERACASGATFVAIGRAESPGARRGWRRERRRHRAGIAHPTTLQHVLPYVRVLDGKGFYPWRQRRWSTFRRRRSDVVSPQGGDALSGSAAETTKAPPHAVGSGRCCGASIAVVQHASHRGRPVPPWSSSRGGGQAAASNDLVEPGGLTRRTS